MNYSKYTKSTRDYLEKVEEYLISKYGAVNQEWEANLMILADNLDLYKDCKKSIKDNGIFDRTTGKKNPLLITIKDLQTQISNQIKHLGLSPYTASRIKQEVEDDEEDFIEGLTSNE